MDDIAAELGVGRRTLFRYYPSKNDIVWGEFDEVLERLRHDLRAADQSRPVIAVIREAAVSSNTYPAQLLDELHRRLTLIQTVPALQAHSMLRYADWRTVIAEYVAERLGCAADDLIPVRSATRRWRHPPLRSAAGGPPRRGRPETARSQLRAARRRLRGRSPQNSRE